jgi:hypothetical protein
MRRLITFSVIVLLLSGACTAFAQNVTFQVNMKVKAQAGLFDPTVDQVTVRGTFNTWGLGDTLTDGDNDSIYVKTIALAPSTSYNYKFWKTLRGGVEWEDGIGDRLLNLGSADTTLPVVYFQNDGPDVQVTFQVNMKVKMLEGAFLPTDVATVRGSFNDWGNSTNNPDTLRDGDADSIYTGIFQVASGKTIDYKFWASNAVFSGSGGYEGSISNRQYAIPLETPTVIPPDYFDGDSVYTPPPVSPKFLTVTPETLLAKDPVKGNLLKAVKRPKAGKPAPYPNWANLRDELIAQGGFAPGTSESDSAGGLLIGLSFMERKNPGVPANPNWKPVKDSAAVHGWVRIGKYNFKKSVGASPTAIPKTLESKTFHHTGPARGLDSTGNPGEVQKRKLFVKEQKILDPKKTSNRLFAELLALKFNIAASQLGKVPPGLGELIFDRDGNLADEMPVKGIAEKADSMMTYWRSYTQAQYDSVYSAIHDINHAFAGPLDTVSFMTGNVLVLAGSVELSSVPFLKLPVPFVAVRRLPTSDVTEPEEMNDFEGEEFEEGGTPMAAKLYQNYPNPFNPATMISFRLLEPSQVTIRIYNTLGQEVAMLMSGEEMEEGYNEVEFNAESLSSGVYFYRIDVQGVGDAALHTVLANKMVLLK